MIKKLILLVILTYGYLFAQPQQHTLSIIPGPTLNGPGAIFYLEDTTSPGANSVSWKAPVSLDSSTPYIWPINSGFNDQPFCTSATGQTSWCSDIVLPNGGIYKGKDSSGTEIGLLSFSSGDWVDFGSLNSSSGSGNVHFIHKGIVWGKLKLEDGSGVDLTLEPMDNKTGLIGSPLRLWKNIQAENKLCAESKSKVKLS